MDLLVIGLGNPGQRFENNRHNVGFKVVELLSKELKLSFKKKFLKPYLYSQTEVDGDRLILVKPQTFMNRSGEIIPYLLKTFKLGISNMLVLCDNLDLEPGRCKLKLKGSPAAHNGLKSITAHIQSNDYMRIFLGVGHPGDRELVREWVVGDPDQSELPLYEEAYKKTAEAILGVLNGQTERVMNELNRKKAPERNP